MARLCRVMSLGAGVLAAAVAATSAPASAGRLLLFGAEELGSRDIGYFPQWTSTLGRLAVDPAAWTATFEPLRTYGARERITAVNGMVNRVAYVEDLDNWKAADHWSTPAEFYDRGGDCEDYAIAKYMALRLLGFAAETLRIVVVEDERSGRQHAVLAVYDGGDVLILDNLRDEVLSASTIDHYRPFYSINELGWWLH